MNRGCFVLSQILDLVHRQTLVRLVKSYDAESRVRQFGCRQQLICMISAQLTWREGEAFGEGVTVGHEPLIDGIGERTGAHLVDDVVDGVVAGKEQMAAFLVAAGEAEGGALVLVEGRMSGRTTGFEVMLVIESISELADFERPRGGGAKAEGGICVNPSNVHGFPSMFHGAAMGFMLLLPQSDLEILLLFFGPKLTFAIY